MTLWTCACPLSELESMAVPFMHARPTPPFAGIAGIVSCRTPEAAREICASRQQCESVTGRSCCFLLGCCCHCLNPPFSSTFLNIPGRISPHHQADEARLAALRKELAMLKEFTEALEEQVGHCVSVSRAVVLPPSDPTLGVREAHYRKDHTHAYILHPPHTSTAIATR